MPLFFLFLFFCMQAIYWGELLESIPIEGMRRQAWAGRAVELQCGQSQEGPQLILWGTPAGMNLQRYLVLG